MAISQSKYINIVSSLGGGSSVAQRELIGRVFTSNYLVPVNKVVEFGGGKQNALSLIADYFGTTSTEYAFASKYFNFETAANTAPQKISFARYVNVESEATLIGKKGVKLADLQAVTNGSMTVKINGADVELTELNFSTAKSFADVANLVNISGATIDYENGRFVIRAEQSIDYATGDVAELMGLTQATAILSEASEVKTPLETVSESAELSNNFFSYCFLDTLTVADITAISEWNDAQNVKYMASFGITESNYASIQDAVKDYDGVALTLDKHAEHAEFAPMAAYAAVNYDKPNSAIDVFYKQFDLTPSVASNAERYIYDPLRINYYGTTQQAGQAISFYQDGVLQGSIPSMTVYANEAWLKDSFITDVLNLRMGLDSLPANNTGKSLVMSALMNTINKALANGVVLAGKELTATQKAYITTITGDEDGWIAVQNAGYRLSAEIEQYEEYGMTKYKISFLFIYSKGDTINYVDGRDILI